MSHLFQLERVKYVCCCGSLRPICHVYFCRHCLRLRCQYCVSQEVDSMYCGNCSENMPTAEAKQKKHSCGTCFDCPSCKQTMSIRATTVQVPSDDDPEKLIARKMFYLACGFCKYTSRDSKIPDSLSSTGPWPEPENVDSKHIVDITDYFRRVANIEKNSMNEKKPVHRSKYFAAGRHGLAHLLPKRFPVTNPGEFSKPLPAPYWVAPSVGEDQLDELDYVEDNFNICKSTGVEQRIYQLEAQPTNTSQLLPVHKQLLIKRSLRCRVCERNIRKPEFSPVSIKFKIQLNAYYHVPRVRMMMPLKEPLPPGYKSRIVLRLSNPTQFPSTISFMEFSYEPIKRSSDVCSSSNQADNVRESSTDISLPSFTSSPSTSLTILPAPLTGSSNLSKEIHILPIKNDQISQNCSLVPNQNLEVILPPKDEYSEIEGFGDALDFNDDPNIVPWRKGNHAALYADIFRHPNSSLDDPPVLGVTMEYDYVNTFIALENNQPKESQKARIQAHLLIRLDDYKDS